MVSVAIHERGGGEGRECWEGREGEGEREREYREERSDREGGRERERERALFSLGVLGKYVLGGIKNHIKASKLHLLHHQREMLTESP